MQRGAVAAVVGAGVLGVTAALELRRRGHRVQLLDAGGVPHPDASSTDASKIVRMDYGHDGFYADLGLQAIEGWRRWNRSWGDSVYHETGLLLLSGEPLEQGGFEADSLQRVLERGVKAERLDRATLGDRFPAWSQAGFVDGYFNPCAGWAESGRVVARLACEAREAGVRLLEGARCVGLAERGSRVVGARLDDGRTVAADTVVVACGAWTPFLLPDLADRMWPAAQPVVFFRPADPRPFQGERFPVWCADITRTGRYGFPADADGLVKVGHHGPGRPWAPGEPLVVREAEVEACLAFVRATFPGLGDAPVARTRLCLYCDSWDGDYLIDHDPDRPGLVVAAGGSGHAFKFAPLFGTIVADVVERGPSAALPRFAWRSRGERRREPTRQRTDA
jgi:glycine/D-amino acid oxidase-like deaminating enzyme